jgi:hypothetical protein
MFVSTNVADSALLTWIRKQESAGHLTQPQASRLEHVAGSASHPLHSELLLHWTTFGDNDDEMLKSAVRLLTQDE